MRFFIIAYGLLQMQLSRVLPRALLIAVAAAIIASLIVGTVQQWAPSVDGLFRMPLLVLLELVVPFTMVFLIWNVLYFAAIYLKNYEREEVKNLRLTAAMNDTELNNLRSQLNPHFMFNALNSIRALVDENPVQAKQSITRLSALLRNTLTAGRRQFISLEEEIKTVKDYLELEKIRYEERLTYRFEISEACLSAQVLPLLIQTLVENAVKHGISRLPGGGDILISVQEKSADMLQVMVTNSGQYNPAKEGGLLETGIGLANSRRRLRLTYGDDASLSIINQSEKVLCSVTFPTNKLQENTYESIDH